MKSKIRDYSRVVVEGMDGSGKSTLVQNLLEYLGDDYAHYVPGYNRVEGDKSPMQTWWMEQLASNRPGKVVVHDRFFYPELIYGPVMRGKLIGDEATRSYVHEFLRRRAFLIYCRPSVATLSKEILVQPQMEGVVKNFNSLLSAYDNLMISEATQMGSRFIRYDWTRDTALTELYHKLTEYIWE